jgi:hypothetical protein
VRSLRGFPPAVTQLKRVLDRMHPTLPKENPGSRWPKTSLGALRDGKRLTPKQLEHLLRICREEGAHLQSGALHPLEVNRAALCIFECRFSSFASWLNDCISGLLLCIQRKGCAHPQSIALHPLEVNPAALVHL